MRLLLLAIATLSVLATPRGQTETRREKLYREAAANENRNEAARRIAKFLEEDPSWARGWALLGAIHQQRHAHKAAVRALTTSMSLSPDGNRTTQALLALSYWETGERRKSLSIFTELTKADRPMETNASREYGKAQLHDFLTDRPSARKVLKRSPAFGDRLGALFDSSQAAWDKTEPPNGFGAQSFSAEGGWVKRFVQVGTRKHGVAQSGEELVVSLAFELFNVRNVDAFDKLHLEAKTGRLRRTYYVREIVRLELEARAEVQRLFTKHEFSIFGDSLFRNGRAVGFLDQWHTAQDLLDAAKGDQRVYPWFPYGKNYDIDLLPHWTKERNFNRVVKTGKALLKLPLSPTERHYVLTMVAFSNTQLGEFAQAVDETTKAISIPEQPHAEAYKWRGYAYLKLGKYGAAVKDLTEACSRLTRDEDARQFLLEAKQQRAYLKE